MLGLMANEIIEKSEKNLEELKELQKSFGNALNHPNKS